jgi:hypothetical protein
MRNIQGTTLSSVLKRTFLDAFCFTPLFVPTFITSLMTLESKPIDDIYTIISRDYQDVLIANWSIWSVFTITSFTKNQLSIHSVLLSSTHFFSFIYRVPAMLLNFKFVPSQWQVLYSNCVGFVWNVYLSWKTQEGGKGDEEK